MWSDSPQCQPMAPDRKEREKRENTLLFTIFGEIRGEADWNGIIFAAFFGCRLAIRGQSLPSVSLRQAARSHEQSRSF